ncbi:hypothetical protein P3T27_007505 [Kitasatospora sp. MAA19]|uniref:hypothetical protein n=1 Tax=unclassified Kitasatospora TaxID=2633591 RepID=UPI002473A924|nr:hypothetical protein [Kitasatospora sp. MAA19]MDH6710754.1 hypothetical protein [Kitasatospora sp. MAA19]
MISAVRRLLTRRPAWERRGHFRKGQQVLTHRGAPVTETVVWVKDGKVGMSHNGLMTVWTEAAEVRHAHGCRPCLDDLNAQLTTHAEEQHTYWNQWPRDARDAHEKAMDDMVHGSDRTHSFGPNTRIPAWMRAEFDGRMHPSTSPSLALGRLWDPLDWPRICREHPDFVLEPAWQDDLNTDALVAAYQLLRDRRFDPYLDVDLEMELRPVPEAPAAITASAVVTRLAVEQQLDPDTYDEVVRLLGDASTHPSSSLCYPMLPDGPGEDRTQPYTVSANTETVWGW